MTAPPWLAAKMSQPLFVLMPITGECQTADPACAYGNKQGEEGKAAQRAARGAMRRPLPARRRTPANTPAHAVTRALRSSHGRDKRACCGFFPACGPSRVRGAGDGGKCTAFGWVGGGKLADLAFVSSAWRAAFPGGVSGGRRTQAGVLPGTSGAVRPRAWARRLAGLAEEAGAGGRVSRLGTRRRSGVRRFQTGKA